MNRYLNRDRAAIAAALVAPVVAAAILLPLRSSWSNTNVALVLVVVVVAVAAIGNRVAGALAAVPAAAWFGFFFTVPYERFAIRSPADVTTGLTGLLNLTQCQFEYGFLLGRPPRLEPDGTVMIGRHRWEVERWGLPSEEIELRTFGNGQYYGRFMMSAKPGSRPSLQARLVAVTLADQVGRALATGQVVRSDD